MLWGSAAVLVSLLLAVFTQGRRRDRRLKLASAALMAAGILMAVSACQENAILTPDNITATGTHSLQPGLPPIQRTQFVRLQVVELR
jgi:hypothetical protein